MAQQAAEKAQISQLPPTIPRSKFSYPNLASTPTLVRLAAQQKAGNPAACAVPHKCNPAVPAERAHSMQSMHVKAMRGCGSSAGARSSTWGKQPEQP